MPGEFRLAKQILVCLLKWGFRPLAHALLVNRLTLFSADNWAGPPRGGHLFTFYCRLRMRTPESVFTLGCQRMASLWVSSAFWKKGASPWGSCLLFWDGRVNAFALRKYSVVTGDAERILELARGIIQSGDEYMQTLQWVRHVCTGNAS